MIAANLRSLAASSFVDAGRDLWFQCRYRKRRRLQLRVDDITLTFSTEDPTSRRWFYPRYLHGDVHEEPVTRLMVRDLRLGKCFIDVGAHLGYYTCLACKVMPAGRVFGLEMDMTNFELLKRNVSLNSCHGTSLHHVAVCDIDGQTMYVRSNFRIGTGHRLASRREKDTDLVRVSSCTLDTFCAERSVVPDIVKVDVEGAELQVLVGMSQILLKNPDLKLYVEVHPEKSQAFNSSPGDVVTYLRDRGFSVFTIHDSHAKERPFLQPLDERVEFSANTMLYASR